MTRIGFTALSIAAMAASSLALAQTTTPFSSTTKVAAPATLKSAPKSETNAPVVETPVAETSAAPVAKAMAIQIAPSDEKPSATAEATPEQKPDIVEAPKPPAPPAITLVAKVDLTTQKVTVYEHGKAKHTWTISSGTRGFETPRGTFQPGWMAKMWFSKQYDNSPMPHSVFFKDGAAFHATQWTSQLGRPASHGCVRLAPANAAKFYALVSSHGMKHTRISVFGTPRHAPERTQDMVASRRAPQQGGQRIATYNGGYSNGYNSYAGNYAPSYSNNGSPFMAKPIPYRPVQIRVVQYGSRGSRY